MRRKMSRSLFCFKFVFFFSLSLAASYTVTSTPTFYSFRKLKLRSSSASPSVPKASAADLLALLAPPQQALAVNSQEARQLRSCFKFLVPFSPSYQTPNRRSLSSKLSDDRRSINEENELIWWPPAPVMELARLAVDSGGDTASIQRTLDPTVVPVPDIEGSKEDRCELTRTPYGRLFINEEINSYLESLFEMIVARGPSVGLNVSLSRFDFFHGHVFLARDSGRLGILFHAKEYPAYDKEVFPCNMGYCQIGTNVSDDDSMNLRNILWLAPLASNSSNEWLAPGVLVVLDARPTGVIYKDLIPEYVQIARTLYEDDFGDVAFDVNYLNTGVITSFSEVDKDEYLDPQTAQVARVDHVKQVCKDVMPARDEELPSAFVEEYMSAMDAEIMKYVSETYPKGICSVYCTKVKDVEEPGFDFELVVMISAARQSPQNFSNGSWRSIWSIEFKDEIQSVEVRGEMLVGAHYFEEGNVQLDAKHECKDTTLIQSPDDSAISLVNIIRHHETEYLASLQTSYLKLPDTTFKDLRRKLPVTRTLFPWHNTAQFSLTRDIEKEFGIGK